MKWDKKARRISHRKWLAAYHCSGRDTKRRKEEESSQRVTYDYLKVYEEESLYYQAESIVGMYEKCVIKKISLLRKYGNPDLVKQLKGLLSHSSKDLHHYPWDTDRLKRIIEQYPREALKIQNMFTIDIEKAKNSFDSIDFNNGVRICGTVSCPKKNECFRHAMYVALLENNVVGHTCTLFESKDCNYFVPIGGGEK